MVAFLVVGPRLSGTGSIVAVHGLSCHAACGIFLDQGSSLCLLHREVGSLPRSHQQSPCVSPPDLLHLM